MEDIVGIAHALSSWKPPIKLNAGAVEKNLQSKEGENNCKYRVARNH